MLWREMQESCSLLEEVKAPDGEGGFLAAWAAVRSFQAAIVQQAASGKTSQQRGDLSVSYAVTSDIPLFFNDCFRGEDGKAYRATSDSVQTPGMAGFSFFSCNAERWSIHDEN